MPTLETKRITRRWWTIALRGVAAILLGVLSLFLPGVTFLSIVILFGVFAIVDGMLSMSLATRDATGTRGAITIRGLASVLAGVLALVWPGITAFALLMVIAAWAIASGVLEIVMAVRMRKHLRHEGLLIVEGILSIVFGAVLFIAPAAGALAIGLWVGAYALVLGVMLIAASIRLRKAHGELGAIPAFAA
jgi:uncharacterized membrane protein HdeD (DUF308 family)